MACLFCEIVAGRIPARKAFEDDALLAFHDINPQAPTHLLVVPKRHITSLGDLAPDDDALVGAMARRAKELARAYRTLDRFEVWLRDPRIRKQASEEDARVKRRRIRSHGESAATTPRRKPSRRSR